MLFEDNVPYTKYMTRPLIRKRRASKIRFGEIEELKQTITLRGYLERTSCIGCWIPAAGDHLISRLEAAPTGEFLW
jgi:hypothetical protein